jgi:predicted restriction endonuclease
LNPGNINLQAEKDLSMLFPVYLNSDKYSKERLVPQIGFTYKDEIFAKQVIKDEYDALHKSSYKNEDLTKLNNIYYFLTGEYLFSNRDDICEQDEIIEILNKYKNIEEIRNDLLQLKSSDPEEILITNKTYKRDNKTIAQLKILREYKCQICGIIIPIRNGKYYIEAAHITPKSLKGNELPPNILILCPNHHKEFDFSEVIIKYRNDSEIKFEMNNNQYVIDLKI